MFITFEGIDGSGKSTQIQLLSEKLHQMGYAVYIFREPGGTELSERVRNLLLNSDLDIHPVTELLLFSSARAQLIAEKVQPLLKNSDIVILDRYYDSTVAYQGYGRKSLPIGDIHDLNAIASHGLKPDVTFYLKISLQIAKERTASKQKDRMEQSSPAFYAKVIDGFDRLAENEKRFIAIDAKGSAGHIHQLVMEHMQKWV